MPYIINNYADVIDSRDVIARLEEIADLFDDGEVPTPEDYEPSEDLDLTSEVEEYATLKALAEEGEAATSEWPHGVTLIRDSYFKSYAEEMAADIWAIDPNAKWPLNCIDWERAARELQVDYTSVDFEGETYWVR